MTETRTSFECPISSFTVYLPHGLALADVTGDGKIDIITALSEGMGVFPGNGNLTFGAPIISTTAAVQVQDGAILMTTVCSM